MKNLKPDPQAMVLRQAGLPEPVSVVDHINPNPVNQEVVNQHQEEINMIPD